MAYSAPEALSRMHTVGKKKLLTNCSHQCQEEIELITNINKEVIFHKMVFESLNLGPSASNSACGSTQRGGEDLSCGLS